MTAQQAEKITDMIPSAEVEKLFRISRMTLYRWRKKGIIDYVEFPRRQYRYSKSEIERIMTKGFNHE